MKIKIRVLLILAIGVLGYLCAKSILDPIHFEEEKGKRDQMVQNALMAIRSVEVEFKNQNGHYTASWDTLIDFVENGKISEIVKEGMLTDEQLQKGMTEKEAVKKGLIKRDTSYIGVKEKLFGNDFEAKKMKYIPQTEQIFELSVGEVMTASGIGVSVFECKAPYEVYLKGLNEQEVVNAIDYAKKRDKYAGMKVGSITEINNNAGNWE
ncbi:MAG TPA: hypothetical protein DDY68_05315 [Porphyromonadaceae bacterium]|nr:hypothetical protein [Porphyromonadaceae bacterium]